jgi:hypothetical protein
MLNLARKQWYEMLEAPRHLPPNDIDVDSVVVGDFLVRDCPFCLDGLVLRGVRVEYVLGDAV